MRPKSQSGGGLTLRTEDKKRKRKSKVPAMMNESLMEGLGWARGIEAVYGRSSSTYRKGRVCSRSGCRTHLSRYNPTERCSIHDELI
jgi:hypothetical protein